MKEVKVAKLDKEDQIVMKDLTAKKVEIDRKMVELHSAQFAWWGTLFSKYNLGYQGGHYIIKDTIYRQE